MDSIITAVTQDPLYGVIGVILVLLVFVTIAKQLLLFTLIGLAALAGFTYYVQSSVHTPEQAAELMQTQEGLTGTIIEKTLDATEGLGKSLKDRAKDTAHLVKKGAAGVLESAKDGAIRDTLEDAKNKLKDGAAGAIESARDGAIREKFDAAKDKLKDAAEAARNRLKDGNN